jgi:hypothetical protein
MTLIGRGHQRQPGCEWFWVLAGARPPALRAAGVTARCATSGDRCLACGAAAGRLGRGR